MTIRFNPDLDYGHARCRNCPSHAGCIVTRCHEKADMAIVLDAPTAMEGKADEWLRSKRGGAGALLSTTIEAAGGVIADMYVCSAINCQPDMKKSAMVKNAMLSCRERLLYELKAAGVRKVLSIGPVGYSALMSIDRVAPITKVRGRWKQAYGMNIMATVPPGFCLGNPDFFRDFARDVEKFITTDGPLPSPDLELWTPESLEELVEAFTFLEEFEYVSCDIETTGFSPIGDRPLAIGYAALEDTSGTAVVIDEALLDKKRTWRLIAAQLNDPEHETVFHNAKFDLQFLKRGITDRQFRYAPDAVHDTMLLNYLIDERPIGAKMPVHGLEHLAMWRFDAPDYGINMGKWLDEWREAPELDRRRMRADMHVYLSLDCYYTARLYPELWNEALDDDNVLDVYERLLIPGTYALADIEYHGILLDVDMFEESKVVLERKTQAVTAKLQRITGIKDFNPGSPQQVQKYIYNSPDDPDFPGLGLPFGLETDPRTGEVFHTARRGGMREGPTAAPVIKALGVRFPEHAATIDLICDYRNYAKNAGTYVKGLLSRVDVDDRLRSTYNINGTATGRLSSSNPNLQNIPDASHTGVEVRGGFIAGEGNVFVYADYKQLEVRIAAWLSGDPKMKEVFESGRDPHQEIAWSIYQKPKEEISHYMRWLAKNILFGLLYGRGPESVATGPEQEDIVRYGGSRWTVPDVQKFFNNLLAEWEVYAAWQAERRRAGYRDGEVTMPSGRKKRFPFIPTHDAGYVGRASFNNPTQGTASDFTLFALIQLHQMLPAYAKIVLTVHDSIMVECPQTKADEIAELMRHVMEDMPLFDIDVPLAADIEIFERWAGDEFEKAASLVA